MQEMRQAGERIQTKFSLLHFNLVALLLDHHIFSWVRGRWLDLNSKTVFLSAPVSEQIHPTICKIISE